MAEDLVMDAVPKKMGAVKLPQLALSALTLSQQCEPSRAAEPGQHSGPGRMGAQQQSWTEVFLDH